MNGRIDGGGMPVASAGCPAAAKNIRAASGTSGKDRFMAIRYSDENLV
ncbi:hypothetical protein CFter6_3807 [Collimonas fungivorans]|uniref:Uncharacterized protein n=1 Tax=Collimonas fungivorans TaxID=158899 RepID=A0A127PF99_9BURK|nr:hypothetical protein CFter6_3807 [Collimonas fungivorans]